MNTTINATAPFDIPFVSPGQPYRRKILNAALISICIEAALLLLLVVNFNFYATTGHADHLNNEINFVEDLKLPNSEPKSLPVIEKTKAIPRIDKSEPRKFSERTPVAEHGLPLLEENREASPHVANVTTTAAASTSAASMVAPSVHSEYIAKIRAAVQNAFVYPAAASALGFHGKVKLKFHLAHKTSSNPTILVGSGMGIIDRAAIQSVMMATYPEPPNELKNSELDCEIWIEYRP